MMNRDGRRGRRPWLALGLVAALAGGLWGTEIVRAQGPGTEDAQWTYLGGDAWHTRYTPADQITPENFEELELAWRWDAGSFGQSTARATPTYVGGKLITVTGNRRHVVALDPATGEVKWTFTEPKTPRYEYSMRKGYGKGIAYGEIDGRGVVFISSPAFFLHALDAETGRPIENWGRPVDLPGFGRGGNGRSGRGPDRRLGPLDEHGSSLRPEYRHSSGDRLHHRVLTANRRERHGGRRQFRRAGISADPGRERARRHSRLRRPDGSAQVEVPRHSATR